MEHAFNTNIARDYDVDTALFIQHLKHWTFKNLANNANIHDGSCWSYDTLEALCIQFPYWSKRQIERIINNSVKAGLVIKGNYNQTAYDRTVWYALTPIIYGYFPELLTQKNIESLYLSISPNGEMDLTEWGNRFHQTVTPIPDTIPDTKPNINNIGISGEMPDLNYTQPDGKHGKKQKPDYIHNQQEIEKNDMQVIDSEREQIKSDYFENQIKKQTVSKLSIPYELKNIQQENIFSIPDQTILDWIANRKKKKVPITKTAWSKINKELAKCKEEGIDPIEAFETMVASGWQSLKVDYFITQQSITARDAAKKRSIELEQKAARLKQQEIDDSKRLSGIMSQASENERSKLRKMIGARSPESIAACK